MGEELFGISMVSLSVVWGLDRTCTKAVEMMTPVPNCFAATKTRLRCDIRVNRVMMIGVKTPRPLVTRMTKSSPMRRGLLYSRSIRWQVGSADSLPPVQCLGVLVSGEVTDSGGWHSRNTCMLMTVYSFVCITLFGFAFMGMPFRFALMCMLFLAFCALCTFDENLDIIAC
jgi:hypothetical protein